MKKTILAVVTMMLMVGCAPAKAEETTTITHRVETTTVTHTVSGEPQIQVDPIAQLLDAIAIVESNNNPNAEGDFRRDVPMAIGAYQLWKIYVDDVNRIYRTNFTYEDRWDVSKSREMVRLYLIHYGRQYSRLTGKPCTLEVLARIHNGGPNGYKKKATEAYWQKVKKELDKMR